VVVLQFLFFPLGSNCIAHSCQVPAAPGAGGGGEGEAGDGLVLQGSFLVPFRVDNQTCDDEVSHADNTMRCPVFMSV